MKEDNGVNGCMCPGEIRGENCSSPEVSTALIAAIVASLLVALLLCAVVVIVVIVCIVLRKKRLTKCKCHLLRNTTLVKAGNNQSNSLSHDS